MTNKEEKKDNSFLFTFGCLAVMAIFIAAQHMYFKNLKVKEDLAHKAHIAKLQREHEKEQGGLQREHEKEQRQHEKEQGEIKAYTACLRQTTLKNCADLRPEYLDK